MGPLLKLNETQALQPAWGSAWCLRWPRALPREIKRGPWLTQISFKLAKTSLLLSQCTLLCPSKLSRKCLLWQCLTFYQQERTDPYFSILLQNIYSPLVISLHAIVPATTSEKLLTWDFLVLHTCGPDMKDNNNEQKRGDLFQLWRRCK